jgi:hypothetical protein
MVYQHSILSIFRLYIDLYRPVCQKISMPKGYCIRSVSRSGYQSFWIPNIRSWVLFQVLQCGFLLEGEDSHGDHWLGSLVELSFKARPGTSYPYITIHLIGQLQQRLMGLVQTNLYQPQYLSNIESPIHALVMKMYE